MVKASGGPTDSAGPRLGELRDERAELLATVAELYYVHGKDQRRIATEIGTSRSNVSRLLSEARRRGIVEIRIHRTLGRASALEEQLVAKLGLAEARVLGARPETSEKDALARVGALAAEYLMEHLRGGLRIGLSWGTSLAAMVDAVTPPRSYDVEVVQILGGLSSLSPSLSGHELGRRLADRLGGTFYYLHAPAIVASAEVRAALLDQPGVADVLRRAQKGDLAFVGIGSLGVGSSRALFEEAGLSRAELQQLKRSGAVGDIGARLFTIDGTLCRGAIDRRVVGIELEDLKEVPRVVAVARGLEKANGILGACRGRWIDVLITDEATAVEVLDAGTRT